MSAFSRELTSFIEIAREGSMRQAAERLNISASALSRQIRILERDLGAELLIRQSKGIRLTPSGLALLAQAHSWLAEENQLRTTLKTGAGNKPAELRLGVMECLSSTLPPMVRDSLIATMGPVKLAVKVDNTASLIKMLRKGQLDVIIAFNVQHSETVRVMDETECKLGLIHAPGFADIDTGPLHLADCMGWPLCLPSEDLSFQPRLVSEILKQRVDLDTIATSNSVSFIREMVRRGECVSFLTWFDVGRDVVNGQLAFVPLAEKRLVESLCTCISGSVAMTAPMTQVLTAIRTALSVLANERAMQS